MEQKHTPGPWVACDRGDYSDYDGNSQVIIGDDTRIAVVQNHGDEWASANAHLIAAAPELLEVCKWARQITTDGSMLQRKIDAVVAKATGAS